MRAATPALESFLNATVRVAAGTGVLARNGSHTVVVTAAHVVAEAHQAGSEGGAPTSDASLRVWSGTGWTDCGVLARDEKSDLAILEAPRDSDGRGLALLDREMLPGEELWTCGHPRGWDSTRAPVLCRGIVAGVDAEARWANLEASWGNSGGALALTAGDRAVLGGIALGRAGGAHRDLEDFRKLLERGVDVQEGKAAQISIQEEAAKEQLARVTERRKQLRAMLAEGKVQEDDVFRDLGPLLTERQKVQAEQRRLKDLRAKHKDAVRQMLGFSLVAEHIEDHFRTGFVRFAGVAAIRNLLGES